MSPEPANANPKRLPRLLYIALMFLAPLFAYASSDLLPVGMLSDFTLVGLIFQVLIILWAIVLILTGSQYPRFTVGSVFLPIAILVGIVLEGSINYLLVLLIALVVFGLLMAAYVFVPRLGVGIASFWPLAAVYAAHLYFKGAITVESSSFMFILAVLGIVGGGVFVHLSLCILGSALGVLILTIVFSNIMSFELVIGAFIVALLWQILVVAPSNVMSVKYDPVASGDSKLKEFLNAERWGLIILFSLFVIMAFTAPQPDAAAAPYPERFAKLVQSGKLNAPGFVIEPENSYYLFGKAYPISLTAPNRHFWNRFLVLFVGKSPNSVIRNRRAIKDAGELEKMRRAAEITSKAFEEIAPLIHPGVNEKEIEQEILRVFRENGADGLAFECIVASGENATLPHYSKNNAVMEKGLVVIDIGCSVANYASDMTRTFPVRGFYTDEERKLMEIVVAAGDSARAHLKAGASFKDLNSRTRAVIDSAGFGSYFNHSLGHHMGLSVHDPQVDSLQAGMVITIEPGIYIPSKAEVDTAYWDLGVRIEDSYIVTEEGYEEITRFPRIPFGD